MHGWGLALMAVGAVLFWGVVITALVVLIRHVMRSDQPPAGRTSGPETLLAERFARGEIDEIDYHKRLDVLRGTSRHTG
jgi:putative membrane protein